MGFFSIDYPSAWSAIPLFSTPSVFICPFLVWRQQYLWRMEDRWTNWWCKSNMAVHRLQALLCAMIRVMMRMDKVLSFSLQSNPGNTVPCELTEARKQVQFTRRVSYLGLCSQGVASVTWLLLLLDVKGEITGMGWARAVQQKEITTCWFGWSPEFQLQNDTKMNQGRRSRSLIQSIARKWA